MGESSKHGFVRVRKIVSRSQRKETNRAFERSGWSEECIQVGQKVIQEFKKCPVEEKLRSIAGEVRMTG